MYNSAIVLLLRKTLEHHVVALWLVIFDQVIFSTLSFHHKRVWRLTDFALKSAPKERREVL